MKSYNQLMEAYNPQTNDLQMLRTGMKMELDAITEYENLAEQADDPRVAELFLDIAKEEKVHAIEFEELIERMDTDYEEAEDKAEEEIDSMFGEEED